MKRFLSILLIISLALSIIPFAYADDLEPPADDPITDELTATGFLSFSGTTAICYGSVNDLGKYIVATLTLYHGGTAVGSWSGSGTSSVALGGNCKAVKGWTYTLVIAGTSNGVPFSSTLCTKTC